MKFAPIKRLFLRIGVVSLLLVLIAVFAVGLIGKKRIAPMLFPAWPVPSLPLHGISVPFTFERCNIVVEVDIGSERVPLVLDSGSTATALDRGVVSAQATTWPLLPPMRVATLPSLVVGGASYRDVRVAVFEGEGNWPRRVKGLLGADFLQTVSVTVDFVGRQVHLRPPGSGAWPGQTASVELHVEPQQPLRPTVDASVDGITGRMLFDTGNQNDVILTPAFVRMNPSLATGRVPATGRESGAPWSRKHGTLNVGGVAFTTTEWVLYDDERGPFDAAEAGNLGCGALARLRTLTIDFGARKLFFEPSNTEHVNSLPPGAPSGN